MSFADEGGGERCHKNYKYDRTHHTRKTSAEHSLTDLITSSLTRTDVKMSHLEYHKKRSQRPNRAKQEFSQKMAIYYANPADDASDIESASDFEESDEEL